MENCAECYLRKRVHIAVADKLKILLNHGNKSVSLKNYVFVCVLGAEGRPLRLFMAQYS